MLRIMECVRCVQRGNGTLAPSPEPPCPPREGRGRGGVLPRPYGTRTLSDSRPRGPPPPIRPPPPSPPPPPPPPTPPRPPRSPSTGPPPATPKVRCWCASAKPA